jgi:hypothetical protein
MIELTTQVTNETSQPTASVHRQIDGSDLLVLTGNGPRKIYVAVVAEGTTQIAGFALEPGGPFFVGGIEWKSGPEFSLVVTFVFSPGITQIKCELPYSAPYGLNLSHQDLCLVRVSDATVTYQAFVSFPSGPPHDPKIIVTPINGI